MLVPRGERGKLLKRRKVVKLCWPSESWRRLGRRSREGRLQRHGHLPYQKWKHQTRCRRHPRASCASADSLRAVAVSGLWLHRLNLLPPPWCTVWTVKHVLQILIKIGTIKRTAVTGRRHTMMYGFGQLNKSKPGLQIKRGKIGRNIFSNPFFHYELGIEISNDSVQTVIWRLYKTSPLPPQILGDQSSSFEPEPWHYYYMPPLIFRPSYSLES